MSALLTRNKPSQKFARASNKNRVTSKCKKDYLETKRKGKGKKKWALQFLTCPNCRKACSRSIPLSLFPLESRASFHDFRAQSFCNRIKTNLCHQSTPSQLMYQPQMKCHENNPLSIPEYRAGQNWSIRDCFKPIKMRRQQNNEPIKKQNKCTQPVLKARSPKFLFSKS